ncbi:MAG: hypothetical protein WD602_04555 [Actinomycetota bacterium]
MPTLARSAIALLALLIAASCDAGDPDPAATAATPPGGDRAQASPTVAAPAACEVSPHVPPDGAVEGEIDEGELWALPTGPWEPQTGDNFRVTVRVAGAGDFAAAAVDPDGSEHSPAIGPVRQFGSGSGLERPGDEWAMVFRFDQPGCWRIDLTRGQIEGAIHFEVFGS